MTKKKVDIVNTSLGLRLSSHEKICQVRMQNILKSIERLEKKVSDLSESVNKGKGVVSVLVFLGSIVAAAIGIFNYK
tara:strand:- start:65 stop:295 length:231 start_codon:yes stop_codon:yes gene_type:complete